ncbi:hypothetical protein G6F65_011760 [Rhizopus arrhizus]|nr:hypothetical protein G6F65_011760 [Rhizopus arrhizus]
MRAGHGDSDGRNPVSRVLDADAPMPALTGSNEMALAEPIVMRGNVGTGRTGDMRRASEPMPTITCSESLALAEPFLVPNFGEAPGQTPRTHSIDDPMPTVTATGHVQLATPAADVADEVRIDINYRMLHWRELARATSFDDEGEVYDFAGNATEITKQIGNAHERSSPPGNARAPEDHRPPAGHRQGRTHRAGAATPPPPRRRDAADGPGPGMGPQLTHRLFPVRCEPSTGARAPGGIDTGARSGRIRRQRASPAGSPRGRLADRPQLPSGETSMSTDNKTLADAQPGGRVRLGDALLPCPLCGNDAVFVPYKNNGLTLKCKSMGCIQRHQRTLRYGIEWLRASMTEHRNTRALSAQPSPGGEGDARAQFKAWWDSARPLDGGKLAYEIAWAAWQAASTAQPPPTGNYGDLPPLPEPCEMGHYTDSTMRQGTIRGYTAGQMRDYAAAALAARQPVGEPVAWLIDWPGEPDLGHYFAEEPVQGGRSRPLYAAPTAQAVDLDELRRAVCVVNVVGQIDGHDVVRRNSVLDVIDVRRQRKADSQAVGK